MKTLIFIILFSSSLLQADFLLAHLERCAKEYYYQDGSLKYLRSDTGFWNTTTTNVGFIEDGWVYDPVTNKCTKTQNLGLTTNQYNFLYSLIGLLFGMSLFWLVPSSKK